MGEEQVGSERKVIASSMVIETIIILIYLLYLSFTAFFSKMYEGSIGQMHWQYVSRGKMPP